MTLTNGLTARELRESTDIKTLHSRDMQVFAIFDNKSLAYANPFYYHQKGQALRAFEDAVNDPQSPFFKHPEDFSLRHVGSWNEMTGKLTPLLEPEIVDEALNVKKQIK